MAEIAIPIVAEPVVAPAASWIKRQISYLFNFKRNVDNFNVQLQSLKLKRERIEHAVDDATRRNMELIERDVEHWLQRVTALINDKAEAFLRETERAKNGCLFVKARYQLSKKAEDLSKDAADLLSAGEKFTTVSYRPPPKGIRFPTIKGYESFESRARHLEDIMSALKNPDVNMIGVWGMGGVGKTTLVKKAAEQANVEQIFDVVVLSEVSLNQDLRKVQGEIAEALGFKFEADEISVRSIQLRERLQKEKKILVILDNIWATLDLGELGIPFGNDHKGCKILMTSRYEHVLDEIGTDSLNIKVNTLDDGEAWNLFEKMAGDALKVPNLHPIAIEIAKSCGGVPILINTVASSLRNRKDSHTWKVALQQLEKFENDQYDAREYSALELSFNNLRSKVMQQLFLLCGLLLYTDYYAIEDLLKYCRILDSFNDNDGLEVRRNKLHKLVIDLKSACFLLDAENGYIKMHDVVSKFARSFAFQKHDMFIEKYDGELEEWPKKNTIAKFSSVCFPHNFIHRLEGLECEELKLFILYSKNRDLEIPSSFFQGVRGIMVLDIKNLIIPSLPSSLYYLNNLCTLSLENCELEDIGIIGNLVGLEILRIVNTNLSRLPVEIRQLTCLKLFSVSNCCNLKVIPPNVISSLTRLEELSMEESFVNWKAEGVNGQNASLAELNKLSKLVSLDIHIPNSNIMANYSFSDKLERFKILIGDGWDWDWNWEWSSKYGSSRRLKLKLSTRIHLKPDVQALLRKTEDLYLDELVDVNSVSELDREGFPRLRCLHVQNGHNFQYIVNTRVPCNVFPSLEVLSLQNLNNLEMICHGQLGVESFNKLRIVKVRRCEQINMDEPISLLNVKIVLPNLEELFLFDIGVEKIWDNSLPAVPHCFQTLRVMEFSGCHKLRFLFPVGVVTSLIQLESLTVRDCKLMEGIIEGVAGQMIFPKLRSVNLGHLPELKGYCIGNSIEFPSLSDVRIKGCPELKSFIFDEKKISNDDLPPPLFDEKIVLPNLEELFLFDISAEKIWDNNLPAVPHCFQTLRVMEFSGCHKLRFLFPVGVVTSLIQLESLVVQDCKLVEGIIEGVAGQMIFPKLYGLNLGNLPELKRFCIGNSIEFPSLSDVRINGCPELKSFIFDEKKISNDYLPPSLFDEKIVLPNLEELSLFDIGSEKIWDNNFLAMPLCFQTLREMELSGFHKLRFLFPVGVVTSLIQLESLTVRDCKLMEGIIEGVAGQMIFRKLRSVNLGNLPELKRYCLGNSIEFPFLSDVRINGCPELKSFIFDEKKVSNDDLPPPLFDEKIVLTNLEELFLFDIGTEKIWDNNLLSMPHCFQTLRVMELSGFHTLRFLFPVGVVTSLIQLESLEVLDCKLMEEIIEGVAGQMIFLKLGSLNLGNLPELKRFCTGNSIEIPSLSDMRINGCPELKSFIFDEKKVSNDDLPSHLFDEKIVLPNLEELSLFDIGSEKIWDNNILAMPLCFQTLRVMELSGFLKLRFLFPVGVVKSLIQLESLMVLDCKLMEGIIEGVAGQMIFPKLRSLNLGNLPELKRFCIGNSIEFPSLSDVRLNGCPELKSFIFDEKKVSNDDLPPPLFDEKIVLPNLKELFLFDIGAEKIWDNNLLAMPHCFQTLRVMDLSGFHKLRFLFPVDVVTSLIHLKSLEVQDCKLLEEIIEGVAGRMSFLKLRSLNLGNLPELKRFCTGNSIEFPSLFHMTINGCPELESFIFDEKKVSDDDLPPPLFDEKIVLPNLKELSLFDIGSEKIWDNNLLAMPHCFQTLRVMNFSGFHKLRFLFPVGVVTSLIQLEILTVRDCKLMEGIIEGVAGQMIFPKLRSVNLGNLPEVKRFCTGNSIEFPSLSDMRINDCPELKSFIFDEQKVSNVDLRPPLFDEKIVLPNLEELFLFDICAEKIWDNNLPAVPHCFQTLRVMEFSGCHKLRFLFPVGVVTSLIQLESLVVQDCKLVEGIIEGVAGQMIFPKLCGVNLENLPELKRFCTGNSIEFPSLLSMSIIGCPELMSFIFDEKEVGNDDLPAPLFDEKVKLPAIERLTILSINLKRLWDNELAQESFCKLDHLSLCNCEKVLHIFPSNMLTRLQNLQELQIAECESIDMIFDLEGQNGLEMRITKAPVFRKLKSIRIYDCSSLKYIFLLSIGIGLQELEELDIERCGAVEKIVAREGVEADVRFEFPNVTSLILEYLPQVRIHTSEWPLLKKLKVYECGNVEEGVHVEQPLFLYEKEIFPHLEELSLTWNYNIKQMWHGELQFKMLKSLEVIECYDESFPPGFFKKLPNLEQLCVSYNTFNEMFPNGEAGEPSAFCDRLKILRLKFCARLKILFPSPLLSFCNLIELEIRNCSGLTYLMSCSTAKSMMRLEKLWVDGCKMMTSIVECVEECKAKDDIIFRQLKELNIDHMRNLSSFSSSAKHAFKFPSLEDVVVESCPNLKTFCEGPLSTFKLRCVRLSIFDIEKHWNGNLNTTIQSLYKEGNIARQMFESLIGDIALN